MRTIHCPASTWRANIRSAVNLAGRRGSALLVALNLAAAAIYFVHVGHGIGLGGYRLDLDVYRTGARMVLHGGDLYGRLPRLGDGHQLSFTYPPFAALSFIPTDAHRLRRGELAAHRRHHRQRRGQPVVLRRQHRR